MCRRNGLTVTLFGLPAMALMKIPVLGAAVIFLTLGTLWPENMLTRLEVWHCLQTCSAQLRVQAEWAHGHAVRAASHGADEDPCAGRCGHLSHVSQRSLAGGYAGQGPTSPRLYTGRQGRAARSSYEARWASGPGAAGGRAQPASRPWDRRGRLPRSCGRHAAALSAAATQDLTSFEHAVLGTELLQYQAHDVARCSHAVSGCNFLTQDDSRLWCMQHISLQKSA